MQQTAPQESYIMHALLLGHFHFAATGLGTASSGAACRAGWIPWPIFPARRRSMAATAHAATSSSPLVVCRGVVACSGMSRPCSAASSSSSVIVPGLTNSASQMCSSSIAYVGRSFGIFKRQPCTKFRAFSEKRPAGKSGGSPSTIAY